MKILRSLDLFGYQQNFTINRNKSYKTITGGFLTVLFILLYIILFIVLGDDCFHKKNPKGYNRKLLNKENDKFIPIKEISFIGGFQIYDDNLVVQDIEEILFLKFYLFSMENIDGKAKYTKKRLKTVPCSELGLSKDIDRKKFDLSKFYCPNLSEISDIFIGGNFNEEKLGLISVELSLCDETISKCKDINKVKEFFNKIDWIKIKLRK